MPEPRTVGDNGDGNGNDMTCGNPIGWIGGEIEIKTHGRKSQVRDRQITSLHWCRPTPLVALYAPAWRTGSQNWYVLVYQACNIDGAVRGGDGSRCASVVPDVGGSLW